MALPLFSPTLSLTLPRSRTPRRRRAIVGASASELGAPPEESLGVGESVRVLKNAAKTRRVPKADVLSALAAIKKAKTDPSNFLETLGGTESPGRTWMLIFTAQGKLDKGRYIPVTAVQRFDAVISHRTMISILLERTNLLQEVDMVTFKMRGGWPVLRLGSQMKSDQRGDDEPEADRQVDGKAQDQKLDGDKSKCSSW